jgi:hypothetical protein
MVRDSASAASNLSSRSTVSSPALFYLRVTVSRPLTVELPSGVVASLRAGEETVLREDKFEAADALSRTIAAAADRAAADCRYTLYRADGAALVPVRQFPRRVDAPGARGWTGERDGGPAGADGDNDARWDEYARLASFDAVEDAWRAAVDKLGGVRREAAEAMAKDSCKLCAGSGRRRCDRCMGASASGRLSCGECKDGRVVCEYCGGSGRSA